MLVQTRDTHRFQPARSESCHQTTANGRGNSRFAVRLDRLQTHKVKCDRLRTRRSDSGRRRRPDVAGRFGEDRRDARSTTN